MTKKTSKESAEEIPVEVIPPESSTKNGVDSLWYVSSGLIIALAAFLRFFWIELKPLHHDEGVNGHFLTTLYREGIYHYDPSNYHGPDLYYLSLAFTKLFGLNTVSVRWSVAVFGLLTVVLALYLRKYLGKIGSLAAALFLALSPGMVYISRYFIHEILFVFLSLAIVVACVLFWDRKKAGIGAVVWMTLLLVVSFMPVSVLGIGAIALKSTDLVWTLRIAIVIVEAVLIFFVMRMLLQWKEGRPIYLMLASASAVLLYATKETAFITHGTMAIAIGCVYVWRKLLSKESVAQKRKRIVLAVSGFAAVSGLIAAFVYRVRLTAFYEWFYAIFTTGTGEGQTFLFFGIMLLPVIALIAYAGFIFGLGSSDCTSDIDDASEFEWYGPTCTKPDIALTAVACVFVFVYLLVLFFTSFFQYPADFANFFTAYAFWTKTGTTDHTQNGTIAYFKWLLQIESPLIFLSVLGTLIAVIKAKHRFALFSGLWSFGLFAAYTIISYKTPWLAISFTLPMCLIGGYAINELLLSRVMLQKLAATVLAVMATLILAFQTYDLNFVRYDDDAMPYVYAHTRRGFEDLVRDVKRYAAKSSKKNEATIAVVSSEYWPMPFYLVDYPKALFHGQLVDTSTDEIIIAHEDQLNELPERYARHYKYIGEYPLRPGVELFLLVRNDLAGPEGKRYLRDQKGGVSAEG